MDGELAISTCEHLVVVCMIPVIYCVYNLWKTSDRWIEYEVKFRLTKSKEYLRNRLLNSDCIVSKEFKT
jgi:hypothetical protein